MNLRDREVNSKTKNKAETQVYLGYVDAEATCSIKTPTDNRWLSAQKMSPNIRSSCRAGSQITAFPCPCSKIILCCSLGKGINEERHCLGRGNREETWLSMRRRGAARSLCAQEALHKGLGHKFTLFAVGKPQARNFLLKKALAEASGGLDLQPILTPKRSQYETILQVV